MCFQTRCSQTRKIPDLEVEVGPPSRPHCGGASNFSLLHVICFLGGLPVGTLALLAWQWYLSARTQQHNFQRLPPVPRGAIKVGGWPCQMLELSTLLSLKASSTHCGARSLPRLTWMFSAEPWADCTSDPLAGPTGDAPVACVVEGSAGFAKMTWQQAPRSGTPSKEKPQRLSSPLLRVGRDTDATLDRTPTVPTDPTPTSPVGSRWFALEDTAGFTTGEAIIIEPDDVTSSCGLRVLVSGGGVTFAAASSGAHSRSRFGVGCAHLASGPARLRMLSTRWKNTTFTTSQSKDRADDALASTGDR